MEFKLVNVTYLEEVCDRSPDLIKEMVDLFREQVSEFGREMEELNNKGDYQNLALLAHKAKSSVAIMGLDNLALMLKELEIKAREEKIREGYGDYISQFIEQTGEAIKELDNYLANLQ